MNRTSLALTLFVPLALLIGCGSEAPHPGELTVVSEPPGAAIALNGNATQWVTPHTFTDLDGGTTYQVRVDLDGHTAIPAERMVMVPFGSSARAAFELEPGAGALSVTSTPPGAAIFLDGEDTGEATPFTFDPLLPGEYQVVVQLTNHASDPTETTVTVEDGETTTADFSLTLVNIPRTVLLEGFSNVYCVGCPTMNANVDFVLHQDGYGPERVLFVKWPAFLSPLDPFLTVTSDITNNRVEWYFGSFRISLPTLVGDGELLGGLSTPVNANGMMEFIDSQPEFADVLVTVTTDEDLDDVSDLSHQARITLRSPNGLDLTGHELNVVLVYEVVETENEGYIEGITEYHWVMRDHVQPSLDIGALAAGVEAAYDVTLNDPLGNEPNGHAVYPENKQIIAWIQNAVTRAVVQAGSTVPPHVAPATPVQASQDDARID